MTLEQARALPWHEHDAIMDQVLEPPPDLSEGTGEDLTGMGFTHQEG